MSPLEDDLLREGAYPQGMFDSPVETCETHISRVFLLKNDVFKLKKPVDMGFLDFRTLAQRKAACDAEVVLNRRLAQETYQGVVAIRRGVDGHARVDLAGDTDDEIVDWAVHMKRMPDLGRADSMLAEGTLSPAHLELLAERMAGFHTAAEHGGAIEAFGGTEIISRNLEENFAQTASTLSEYLTRDNEEELRSWQRQFLAEHELRFAERRASGRIRDGHGDLRLEHVYFGKDGAITVLDCIEFNERFRYADVASDIAFLSMDLASHGRVDLAELFLALYARHSNDFDLYGVVDFYESYRAFVRGKISSFAASSPSLDERARRRAREEARRYFLLALSAERRSLLSPQVVAVGGIIASGKSTIADRLGQELGAPVVEADRTRKGMLGVGATERLSEEVFKGAYDPALTERVYAELRRRAAVVLASGRPVILDASFRSASMRQLARSLAEECGVPFHFVECRVPMDECKARLERRAKSTSVSDGRLEILESFVRSFEPVVELPTGEHLVLDTSRGVEKTLDELTVHLETWPRGLVS